MKTFLPERRFTRGKSLGRLGSGKGIIIQKKSITAQSIQEW